MAVDMTVLPLAPKQEPKEKSQPLSLWLPEEYKSADINPAKGIITAYLTVYKYPDGTDFVDPYLDVVEAGAFSKTIHDLENGRKSKNNPYLCADLWQHDRKEIIGGIKGLTEDSRGVIYEAQLALGVQRAREAFELAAQKMVGSSYGYDPIRFQHKGDNRHLIEVRLHEVSQVTFPANDLAGILETKSKKFFVPPNLPTFPSIPDMIDEETLAVKAVCGSTSLVIGPRQEEWDWKTAHAQYKDWGMSDDGTVQPDRWKQVHLFVDGNPQDPTSYYYPYCYINDGTPHICVDAVRQLSKQLKSLKTPEAGAMRTKCVKMLERINTKYHKELATSPHEGMSFDDEMKQDFSTAWTQKLPGQMLQEFFRMSDTLSYVLLNNFDDDDVSDKSGSVDTCCTQFASQVKTWLPDYLAAEEAQDALNNETESVPMGLYGMFGLDMAHVSVKHVSDLLHDEINVKEGRTLSERNKKKLRETIENINRYLSELTSFVDGGDTSATSSESEEETPKHDITQDLALLSTLTPVSYTSSTSQEKEGTAPISFPTVADETDITDLLHSIQLTIKKGGTEKE